MNGVDSHLIHVLYISMVRPKWSQSTTPSMRTELALTHGRNAFKTCELVAAKTRVDVRFATSRETMSQREQRQPSEFLKRATATVSNVMLAKRVDAGDTRLNSAQVTEICASTNSTSFVDVAKMHNCQKGAVTRSVTAGAHALLLTDELLLQICLEDLMRRPPHWATMSCGWDETKELLKFKFGGRMFQAGVHCMVMKLVLAYGNAAGDHSHFHEFITPPMPLTSTGHKQLRNAIKNGYYTKGYGARNLYIEYEPRSTSYKYNTI